MNVKELLLHEWACTYDQEDWYPPLSSAVSGLDAAKASWKPTGEACNTIWENVSHLLYYKERFYHRLSGTTFSPEAATNEETFAPAGSADDEDAWQATLQRVEQVNRDILEKLSSLSEEELQRSLPTNSILKVAMSLVLHDAFHTGQIVQLRKLQGSWPAQRS
jgi:uncharacterized damage-inducible protein DinB